jgi:hypothetical protein
MQERIRHTAERDFPQRQKFVDLHGSGGLGDPDQVAREIWALLDRGLPTGAIVDLRRLTTAQRPPPGRRAGSAGGDGGILRCVREQ